MLFLSNVKESYRACVEADRLQLPTIGIVDSDAPTLYVDIAIPGNDEGVYPTIYYNSMVSMFILYKKFNFIYQGYLGARTRIRKKKEDLFRSPLSLAFKSIELYPMRQLGQDAKRDEVVKRRKAKEYDMETSTKFFNFYGKITRKIKKKKKKRRMKIRRKKRTRRKRTALFSSLAKKRFFFSKRKFKGRRMGKPKVVIRKTKAIRYLNQFKGLYATRGKAYKAYVKYYSMVRKYLGILKGTLRRFAFPIRRRERRRRGKPYKKGFYRPLFRKIRKAKVLLFRIYRKLRRKKMRRPKTRRRINRYIKGLHRGLVRSTIVGKKIIKLFRIKTRNRKGKAILTTVGKRLKPMVKLHIALKKKGGPFTRLNEGSRKLFNLNKLIRKTHKSKKLGGSRIDFLRRKTNAYDIIRPRKFRKKKKIRKPKWKKRRWGKGMKRRRKYRRPRKGELRRKPRKHFKIRKMLGLIEKDHVKEGLMSKGTTLNDRAQHAMLKGKPFKVVRRKKRKKRARILFSKGLSIGSKSKVIFPIQPVLYPKNFARVEKQNSIMRLLSVRAFKKEKKEALKKWRKQRKQGKRNFWKHTKRNYRRT